MRTGAAKDRPIGRKISRFPREELRRVHGVYDHAGPAAGLANAPFAVLPSPFTHRVGAQN
jgi:hypothetical protein